MRPARRLLLVTGCPRSGTTAVGRFLSLGWRTGTLHEPFNRITGLKQVEHYFAVPGAAGLTEQKLATWVHDLSALRLAFKREPYPGERGLRRLVKRLLGSRPAHSHRLCRANPLLDTIVWKDPFACFAARFLVTRLELPVLVTLRDPFAVAASFKRMGWAFDLDEIRTRQRTLGAGCAPESSPAWEERARPVANAALLWQLIYSTLGAWMAEGVPLVMVDLDVLVARPVETYRALYERFGLAWSARTAARIERAYGRPGQRAQPRAGRAHDAGRALASVNRYWQGVLDPTEVDIVRSVTGALWEELRSSPRLLVPA
jgi:hypothetical protein